MLQESWRGSKNFLEKSVGILFGVDRNAFCSTSRIDTGKERSHRKGQLVQELMNAKPAGVLTRIKGLPQIVIKCGELISYAGTTPRAKNFMVSMAF